MSFASAPVSRPPIPMNTKSTRFASSRMRLAMRSGGESWLPETSSKESVDHAADGEVSDATNGVSLARALRPDAVIVDARALSTETVPAVRALHEERVAPVLLYGAGLDRHAMRTRTSMARVAEAILLAREARPRAADEAAG